MKEDAALVALVALVEEVLSLKHEVAKMAELIQSQTATIEAIANMEADRDDKKTMLMWQNLVAIRESTESDSHAC